MQKSINNSFISSVSYNAERKQLKILFKEGKTYTYFNVSQNIVNKLLKAKSKGRFFSKNIQRNFAYRAGRSRKMVVPVKAYSYKLNGKTIQVPRHTRTVNL